MLGFADVDGGKNRRRGPWDCERHRDGYAADGPCQDEFATHSANLPPLPPCAGAGIAARRGSNWVVLGRAIGCPSRLALSSNIFAEFAETPWLLHPLPSPLRAPIGSMAS